MRKQQQKQVIELIETLREAQSAGLYAEAREGALAVCGFIDKFEGEKTRATTLLEEYCTLLVKAIVGEIGEKELRKHLNRVEASVYEDLRQKKTEIVFISYNASMADSILSIYMAAKKDPNCTAVWLPVPYFERNPDGSFGVAHYDGADCYTDQVECADWRYYDLEKRRPDVIVTFNPYDANNYVTSIHPDFYCERMRDLTDLLVYVPYYTSLADRVEDGFCIVAGSVYAHKVILQSEKICSDYIRIFKENFENRLGNPEDKFIAMGSPKFDMAVSAGLSKYTLPDEWKKLIMNSDGSKKKTVLYNLRLTDMSAGIENQLNKAKAVLEYFKQNDNILLWFRPHPLNLECMKSMRSHLAAEYVKIIDEYKCGGWGIYDDTSDLHRAIAASDAYYGDVSSVVALYAVEGKPIMISNETVESKETGDYALVFSNQFIYEESIWFTLYNASSIFKINQKWEVEYVGSFPSVSFGAGPVFSRISECNGKLFMAPSTSKDIGVYDLHSDKLSSIAIRDFTGNILHRFHECFAYKDNVFFFGVAYPAILKLDTITENITYITDWVSPLEKLKINNDNLFFGSGCVNGHEVILSAQSANAVLIFDMDDGTSNIVAVPSENKGYDDICFDGEYYWLAARHSGGTIVKWSPEKGAVEIPVPNGWAEGSYWVVCYANGYVWYFPSRGKFVFKVNVTTHEMEIAEEFMPECRLREQKGDMKTANYFMVRAVGNVIYAHTGTSHTYIKYNTETGERREERITISREIREKLADDIESTHCDADALCTVVDCMFRESDVFNLNDFVERIVNSPQGMQEKLREAQIRVCRANIINSDGTAGQKIYDELKKLVLE